MTVGPALPRADNRRGASVFESLKRSWKDAAAKAAAQQAPAGAAAGAPAQAASVFPSIEQIPALAAEFVGVFRAQGMTLDYSLTSLDLVDRFLVDAAATIAALTRTHDPRVPGLVAKNVNWAAAYLGEVLRRTALCHWETVNDVPLLTARVGVFKPFQVVVGVMRDRAYKTGDVVLTTTRAYAEAVQQGEHDHVMSVVRGNAGTLEELKASIAADGELAAWIVVQVNTAVLTAGVKWGVALDFSLASMDTVEEILAEMHRRSAAAAPGQGATPAQIDGAVKAWGPYVGEVLRRLMGGRWTLDRASGVIALEFPGGTMYPLSKVRKRLVDGEADNVAYYVKVAWSTLAGDLTGAPTPTA